PVYLMYSFPVILIYGTATSTISDYLSRLILKDTNKKIRMYISLILHVLFGLVLLWYSLIASLLFFITDYILSRKAIYKWMLALKSLIIPILVWIIFMGCVYIMAILE